MEVSDSPSPTVQRRRLRAELRRARRDAGLTQEQVAAAMDWSLSKLIRIENGTRDISHVRCEEWIRPCTHQFVNVPGISNHQQ